MLRGEVPLVSEIWRDFGHHSRTAFFGSLLLVKLTRWFILIGKMKWLQKGCLATAVLLPLSATAHAGVRFSLVGVGNLPLASANLNGAVITLSGKLTYGGGALIELPLGPRLGLELGGLYLKRRYDSDLSASGVTSRFELNTIEVPVALKIWLHRAFFLSLGGYVSSIFGEVTESDPASGLSAAGTVSDLRQRPLNYGAMGGLGLSLPLGGSVALRAEGRYQYALQNSFDDELIASSSTNSLKYSEVHAFVGLTIGGSSNK